DDVLPEVLVAKEGGEDADEHHRRRGVAPAAALEELPEQLLGRRLELAARRAPRRHGAAEGAPPLAEVVHLRAVLGGPVERRAHDLLIGERDVEAIAEAQELLLVQRLLLVRDVLAFARLAEA